MTTNMREAARLAVELATEAGELLRKGQNTAAAAVAATKSSAVDIVTELDQASEQLIVDGITASRPEDGLLGEEGASRQGTSSMRWVIDPLDGTVNFTYGIPQYAVSIGVEIDGVAQIGVVFNPATEDLFTAVAGEGAQLNGRNIETRPSVDLSHALVATGFGYQSEVRASQSEVLRQVLPKVRDIRRLGCASLDMCGVAIGRVDAYYERGGHRWDFCGGEVVAREAGLTVTSFEGGAPTNSAIVAPAALHAELKALVTA